MNRLGWAMLSKGSEALEMTQLSWKVLDCVGEFGKEGRFSQPLVVYCVSFGWETNMMMVVGYPATKLFLWLH